MSRPPARNSTRAIAAILKAAKLNGAVSVTLADGTVVRFVNDAPSTATEQAPANEWSNAKPY
jgi:hypothetical protein